MVVTADDPLVDTTPSTVSCVVDSPQILELPLNLIASPRNWSNWSPE